REREEWEQSSQGGSDIPGSERQREKVEREQKDWKRERRKRERERERKREREREQEEERERERESQEEGGKERVVSKETVGVSFHPEASPSVFVLCTCVCTHSHL